MPRIPGPTSLRTETAIVPREAFFAPAEDVHRRQAVGRVAAEIVTPYPPGTPLLMPGQVISEEILSYLKALDVREIHGYEPRHGLRVFTQAALEELEQASSK